MPAPDRRAQSGHQRVHYRACRKRSGPSAGRRSRAGGRSRSRTAARRADFAQGPLRPRRNPDDGRVARARGAHRHLRRGHRAAPARGGGRDRGKDQPARVRARHHQRRVRVRAGETPARSLPLGWRIVGRLGRVGAGGHGVRVDRHRHRRIDPHSRRRVRSRRVEARPWRDRRDRCRAAQLNARSRRAAVPVRRGRGHRV